jgi:hypothetical protein
MVSVSAEACHVNRPGWRVLPALWRVMSLLAHRAVDAEESQASIVVACERRTAAMSYACPR